MTKTHWTKVVIKPVGPSPVVQERDITLTLRMFAEVGFCNGYVVEIDNRPARVCDVDWSGFDWSRA